MSKRSIALAAVLIGAVAGGLFIWRSHNARASAARAESKIIKGLSAEEISLLLKSQAMSDAAGVSAIAETTETRKAFLAGMREYLALAAEARREGLADVPEFHLNFEHKKNMLLADLYMSKLGHEQGKSYVVPKEQLDAVWKNPESEKQFQTLMETMRAIQMAVGRERGDQMSFPVLQGEALIKARNNWARTKVLSDMAKSDGEFMSGPALPLRFKILEAGILSADYLRKHWATNIRATEQDIRTYLAAHPEYDLIRKRQKAETILQRALGGEDFGKLAGEFSEDRSTRDKGGLYENLNRGDMWEEVETAALALNDGEVAGRLIETHTGYHIVKLEKKVVAKASDGKESVTFSLRHILLQRNFEEPGNKNPEIPRPFMKAEEIAKAEVEKEKRNKFVDAIIQRNPIALPDDFAIDLTQSSTSTLFTDRALSLKPKSPVRQ